MFQICFPVTLCSITYICPVRLQCKVPKTTLNTKNRCIVSTGRCSRVLVTWRSGGAVWCVSLTILDLLSCYVLLDRHYQCYEVTIATQSIQKHHVLSDIILKLMYYSKVFLANRQMYVSVSIVCQDYQLRQSTYFSRCTDHDYSRRERHCFTKCRQRLITSL